MREGREVEGGGGEREGGRGGEGRRGGCEWKSHEDVEGEYFGKE